MCMEDWVVASRYTRYATETISISFLCFRFSAISNVCTCSACQADNVALPAFAHGTARRRCWAPLQYGTRSHCSTTRHCGSLSSLIRIKIKTCKTQRLPFNNTNKCLLLLSFFSSDVVTCSDWNNAGGAFNVRSCTVSGVFGFKLHLQSTTNTVN